MQSDYSMDFGSVAFFLLWSRLSSPTLNTMATRQLIRSLSTAAKPLYSAKVVVQGARKGNVKGGKFNQYRMVTGSSQIIESINLGLTMSKALGGDGEPNKSNPEELFAAGFGGILFKNLSIKISRRNLACFQSAMNAVAVQQGVRLPNESTVISTVHLNGDMKKLDLTLGVDLEIKTPQGIEKSKMQEIVDKAEQVILEQHVME
jgi:organic hydroperoxide reductase OsmC/OhrA